jgi:hypothetical protein
VFLRVVVVRHSSFTQEAANAAWWIGALLPGPLTAAVFRRAKISEFQKKLGKDGVAGA